MYRYAVSFEIRADATYAARYNSLMEQLKIDTGIYPWDETTSFVLVSSTETIEQFADRIYFKSKISSATDIVLVVDHASNIAIARGPVKYPALLSAHFSSCSVK
ncbi:hypothetical protein [Sphingorhabdus sp. YGSMI21]|uniref:hypothetical protein n=1 Tax=Sphingorhabdus sp. YGSMI21 TaxID=2077182 RepID=UPI000F4D8ADC|nr:hypothetical protein [Sphingorhabdus sp. YGSMI21]